MARVHCGVGALTQSVEQALQAFAPALPLAVGLSGGADSTALLVACAQRWPGQVVAIHVHHGLQAAADDFAHHCARLCERLGVPLWLQKVDAQALRGKVPKMPHAKHVTRVLRLQPLLGKRKQLFNQ